MRLTTPGAVLLGLLSIAVAVFLALRTRVAPVGSSDAPASTSVTMTGAPIAPAPDLPLPIPPPPAASPPVLSTGATEDATSAMAAQHAALVKACWGSSKAERVAYLVRAQFDEKGHLKSRLELSPRGPVPLEISECVANKIAPFTIAPANAPASVEVLLTLP